MSNINSIVVSGRTGGVPDAKYTPDGLCVATFGLAVKGYKSKQTNEDVTHWIDCKAFGKLAELICKAIPKGGRVVVGGEIRQEKWKTADGSNRSKVVVVAQQIDILDWAESYQTSSQPNDYAAAKGRSTPAQSQQTAPPDDGFDDIPF